MYTLVYLAAIVAANLIATHFGPSALLIDSFLFIGLNLTTRDKLHDEWQGRGLGLKMGALIAAAGLLSFALNAAALPIAIASMVAIMAAESVDTAIYSFLHGAPRLFRVNASNFASSLVDSVVFPTLAFGGFDSPLVLKMFVVKFLGGFAWSLLLNRKKLALQLAALLVFLIPTKGHAQIAAVDAGRLFAPVGQQTVVEAYLAGPEIVGLRPYTVTSFGWGESKPTVLAQVQRTVVRRGPMWATLDAGLAFYPFLDYRPRAIAGGSLRVRLPWESHAFALVSVQPEHLAERSALVGVSHTLKFWR